MSDKYETLTREQLIELLKKRDRTKKLGLVWERDEIAADQAIDENFIACEIVPELSDKPAPWPNMVIEGDNFDALRWLRMTLAGRVKCIYIDPPYNTGNKDWVYNDRYMDPEDRFRQSTWLEFLYRRFTLARDLLAEDGVMLVSINDEQRALLELMMDEAMPGMKLGCFVWRTRKGGYDSGNFSKDHDFVMIYRNPKFEFAGSAKQRADFSNDDDDPRGPWTDDPLQQPKNYKQREGGVYLIRDPDTDIYYPPNPNRVWSVGQRGDKKLREAAIEDLLDEKLIIFKKKGEFVRYETFEELQQAIVDKTAHKFARLDLPNLADWVGKKIGIGSVRIKKFLKDRKETPNPLSSLLDGVITDESYSVEVGKTAEGTRAIRAIFGGDAFEYPKPPSLIRELIRQSARPGDIVLDFFAGSATTAQAVMELNAEDGGDRRFIMVSSTEATEDEPEKNLCRDVTAERVRRLHASDDPKYADLAAPFAYMRTREIAFEDLDYDLDPKDAWAALETLHGLPLTAYDPAAPWNAHEGEGVTLVMVDRYDAALLDWLRERSFQNVFVYSWAPGQLARELAGVEIEIRSVRDTLVRSFQQ
ncbi:site-specific DNA-methyltransferase [Sinisalibacter lacisalsi]|uniref:site-specific DNA-methyltransferase (adenine-specific) n=1 Tax=Sinisalibacter lacisalsi TaxID=1526570 RepID=A0ABQ1QUM7_9RHOB|nr:site-specific DNA-methyltransferase [Sinisalibacter lacisalsi]GGD44697.1 site-specific DNA-methyltransferase [Sinisalibacter lacisalsi]